MTVNDLPISCPFRSGISRSAIPQPPFVHIARLRKKLGDNGRCIGNRTGFGYYYTNN